jgi:hypothetical protein
MLLKIRILSTVFCLFVISFFTNAQSTSWRGTTSTSWTNAANWTNGVPTATVDAILGDASFTGVNQPTVNATGSCKSLTIGGAVVTTLTLTKNLTVSGSVTINSNATVNHSNSTLTLTGNWTNNGTYNTTSGSARVAFGGVAQTLGGTVATTFRRMKVNTTSTVTLTTNITATGTNSYLYVYGTLNPGESPTYTVTSGVLFRVFNNGRIKVNASTFAGNYILSGTTTFSPGCRVEYSATTTNQIVSNSYTYSTLIISGAGTVKTLAGNLPALNSSTTARGNIFVNSGTLDLSSFTANRNTTTIGGEINVANGATLKIGGTNTFPANYNTRTLNLSSTAEYNGANQTVSAQTYGNLILSSSSGAVTKTMPGTPFTVEGNFTSTTGSGTSVSFTSLSNIIINGSVTIGASTTFNGNSNAHIIRGNWINNGMFTGNTGTITFDGAGTNLSGAGAHNFNNITFSSTGISAAAGTVINVSGNLATTGAGQFVHNSGGIITMSGATKTITGANIVLNDLTVSGSVTASTSFIINSNLSVSGSFTGSTGAVTMTGTSKTISGAGAIAFSTLAISGSVTTTSNFSISSLLNISGSFSATAGTATFTGTSVLTGTANLYNVTINGTSLQLSASAVLGIANVFTITAGTLNVTATAPNTVNFNGTGAQNINAVTYHHLILSNGNTKTATGDITVNGNLTISASTTFSGSTYTQTVLRNWINNGTYTASTGTVQFAGPNNATITGATVFNILTVNKSASTNSLSLINNITAATVNMTSGTLLTGANTLTITTTRNGNGIILGTITRTHSFTTATAYAFEGPDNTITFSSVSGVGSITVTITLGSIGDFPNGASMNREYIVSVPAGTYTATLRLHYEDAELNGNDESVITLWNYSGGVWTESGKSGNNTTSNYVEQNGLTDLSYRWTCSETPGVVRWNGSVSSDWNTAANWTTVNGSPSTPPSSSDIVQIGTATFTNEPAINNSVTVKSIQFGSVQAATLAVAAGGSLTTTGNISGVWSANAVHTINAGNQNITVNGNLILSNGNNNQSINISIGTGSITVSGALFQSGNASIDFTGAGTLNLAGNFNYTAGSFTAGSGTVIYNGTGAQAVAAVTYNHLTINKSSGIASVLNSISVNGNLTVVAGTIDISASPVTIAGDVSIGSGATMDANGVTINTGGNWSNSGTFIPTAGSVVLNGTAAQTISAGNFNHLTINKSSGTAILAGNNVLEGDLILQSGTLDLATYTCNRSSSGGSLTIAAGTTLLAGGSNNFPSNFSSNTINATSLVHYNGTGTQSAAGYTYGHLSFSNGGSNAKTLLADAVVAGDLTINSGATFHSGGYTLELSGNWSNSGTFTPSTGTVVLNGSSRTVTGNTTFYHVTVNGSYTVAGSDITYNGHLHVTGTGSYTAGAGTATVSGDLTNEGSLTSTGTTNFTGTSVQTLRLVNALASSSTGVVNFNGNVSPVMNSTSSPQFATLNINNTAGINPSVDWTVFVAMNVNGGGIFNGGLATHTVFGSFTNNGTVTSAGTLQFTPITAKTINFGGSGFSSDGIVKFGGSGQITLAGTPALFTNVIINNTHSAGVSPNTNWTIDSNFAIANNSIFNAGSHTYTVGGNIESDGRLNGGTSTFVMSSSAGELSASAETEFNHFSITGTITPQTDFRVAGNFTNNGTYDGTIGVLIMTGGNAATIGGTTAPSPIAQLTIEKTGGAVVTQNVNLSNLSFLNIFSGVLFTSTRTITQDAGGGILIISDGATLRLGGTNSLPGFSGYGLDVNSNVDYAGTTQAVGNAANYGNLLVTAAGNKNAFVPVVVQGNLTITAGTLATSTLTVTHSVAGNFIMTGGTLSGTSSTYLLNGTADQTLTLLSNLINLTVNKTSGQINLGSNVTVNQTLNMTSGKIDINSNNLTIGSAGSITNANSSNYIIAAGSGTLIQQVTAGGSKEFPVGSSTSYLPATVALTGASTTDNFNVRLLPAVYENGTSGPAITVEVVNTTWLIAEAVNGGSDATITLQWPASLELSGFNRAACRLAHFTAGSWELGATDLSASGSNPYTLSRSGFTGFSPFTVGTANILPVTWLNFTARHENGNNHLYWSTANETHNRYFIVEVSTNGINYTELGRINGAGTTSLISEYRFIHYNVRPASYYYRIRQVDLDGRSSLSKVVRIKIGSVLSAITLYPNPVIKAATLELYSAKPILLQMTVSDMTGKVVISRLMSIARGANSFDLDMEMLPAGAYTVALTDEQNEKQILRVMKK